MKVFYLFFFYIIYIKFKGKKTVLDERYIQTENDTTVIHTCLHFFLYFAVSEYTYTKLKAAKYND